jgi:PPOX class probable F420-dependent enzyme
MALTDERYIQLTTFRRDGTAVATTVWLVDLGGDEIGFWTSSGSGKAKRLAHTPRVLLQPCNGRGVVKPDTEPIEATARLTSAAELDGIRQKVVAKYGFQTKVTKLIATLTWRLQGKRIAYGDSGVIITIPNGS